MQVDYAIQGEHSSIPSYLRRQTNSKQNFNFSSPSKNNRSHQQRKRPSSTNSTQSERQWTKVSSKVQTRKELILLNKRRSHRIRSLTMRPPIVQQASLVPDDMRMSTKLPPMGADIQRLTLFLEQAENRVIKGYKGSNMQDLLLEKQLLYSATFAELSAQVSVTGGQRTATFLNRIWKLNQSIFEEFITLHNKGLKEADRKVKRMQQQVHDHKEKNNKKNDQKEKMPTSIMGVVRMQLSRIREKRNKQKIADQEAKIAALTQHVEFVPPTFGNESETDYDLEEQKQQEMIEQYGSAERAEVQAMGYSGCDKELERFATEMIEGAKPKTPGTAKKKNTPGNKKTVKESWVKLPGVLAAVDHFSAIVVVNADVRGVLSRGQRIKIGSTKMCVHTKDGKFSALSFPVDRFWAGEPTTSMPLYVKNTDIKNIQTEEDSDIEDEHAGIDWVVVPCTCSLTQGDNMVFTSSDITKIIKKGTKLKIKGNVFSISELQTFNYELFSLDATWKGLSEKGVPMLANAEGIWGWDTKQDAIDQARLDKNSDKKDVSPWVPTGLTIDVSSGKDYVRSHVDSTCILKPGQLIKIDQTTIHLSSASFDKRGFTLEATWNLPSVTEVAVFIRRVDCEIAKVRLRDSYKLLGVTLNASLVSGSVCNQSTASQTEAEVSINCETQTTQTDLGISPDEDISTGVSEFQKKKGITLFHEEEMKAARKIMLISRRLEKRGTLAMDLSNTAHLFVQICCDKRKADGFASMLNQKHLTFPAFALDFFLAKFGLIKLAHKNLARFVLSCQKFCTTNAMARVAIRTIGFVNTRFDTHLMLKWSDLMLDVYHDLQIHRMGNMKCLADPVKVDANKTANSDVYTEPILSHQEIERKNTAIIVPRISLLACWDILRIRLKLYTSARHHFGIKKDKKRKKRGRWVDLSKPSFVSSSFIKMKELAHVAPELIHRKVNIDAYIESALPGKKERADVHGITHLAIDLFGAMEIIVDTCRAAFSKDQKKAVEAAKALFSASDEDHNGYLTLDEFQAMMRKVGAKPSQHNLSVLYNSSANENGQITASSFATALQLQIEKGGTSKSVRKIRRAARKLHKKIARKKKHEGNKVDGEVKDASNSESDDNIDNDDNDGNDGNDSNDGNGGNDGNDDKVNAKESKNERKNSAIVEGRKFVCENCQRSFVREKGLEYHMNECSASSTAASAESSNNVATDAVDETLEESNEDEVYNETLEEHDDGTDDEDDLVPVKEKTFGDFSRALLTKIIQILNGKDLHTDLITIWNTLTGGGTCLELTTFQATVLKVAGFYPSFDATSSFFLNLDDDRSGYVEQQEFFNFARTLFDDDGTLIVDQNLLDNTVLVDEKPAGRHLPTHIDGSSLDGWELLMLTWTLDEKEIRTMVHDFGGHEEKFALVLLDELTMAREGIDDAWKSFRSLSAFKSRMS